MHFTSSPQAGLPRRWWPLAVSLAVHALLVGLWVRHVDLRPVAPEAPEHLTVLVIPAPVLRPPPEPTPAPRNKKDEKARRSHVPVVAGTPLAVAPVQPPAPLPSAAATPQPARLSAADILDSARHDIGKLSRDAGGGKLGGGELRAQESAWDRFGQRVADAHVESARSPSTDHYTSPDGQTYYRTKVGSKYYCRKTGSLDPSSTWKTGAEMHANSMSTLGMGGTAGLVLCPGSERDWKRE
jgi:hypothetical protein